MCHERKYTAGVVGCAKSPCEALRLDTGVRGDFAHAVGLSMHGLSRVFARSVRQFPLACAGRIVTGRWAAIWARLGADSGSNRSQRPTACAKSRRPSSRVARFSHAILHTLRCPPCPLGVINRNTRVRAHLVRFSLAKLTQGRASRLTSSVLYADITSGTKTGAEYWQATRTQAKSSSS